MCKKKKGVYGYDMEGYLVGLVSVGFGLAAVLNLGFGAVLSCFTIDEVQSDD